MARDKNIFALEKVVALDFGVSRSRMLDMLAEVLWVPEERKTAFLGRFQHLQRLSLIEGINPGRGRAAEYSAHQVVIIAIAMHMLQLGLTPERAVEVLKSNAMLVGNAISIAVSKDGISPSMISFDPAVLSRKTADDTDDIAEMTFDYGGTGTGLEQFKDLFVYGWMMQRMAYVSISGIIWNLIAVLEGHTEMEVPTIGEASDPFFQSLLNWTQSRDIHSLK